MNRRGQFGLRRNLRGIISFEIYGPSDLRGRIDVQIPSLDSCRAADTAGDIDLSRKNQKVTVHAPVDGVVPAKGSDAPCDLGIPVDNHIAAEQHDVAPDRSFQTDVSRVSSNVSVYPTGHPHRSR